MSKEIKLSKEEAEQLFSEIDNQGFGYWVENYGYESSEEEEEDHQLSHLCYEAKKAMKELNMYIEDIWEHYEIG